MNVAIFTDNDFDKVNGVTTTLTAAREYALTRRWSEALQPLYRAYRELRDARISAAPRDVLALPVG